jgi:hypothetical protein
MAFFYVSGLLLIAEHYDNPFGRRYLHTQELLSYDCIKFVHEASPENREVPVINVNQIKCERLYSGIVQISEDTGTDTFPTGLIGFHPKPCTG